VRGQCVLNGVAGALDGVIGLHDIEQGGVAWRDGGVLHFWEFIFLVYFVCVIHGTAFATDNKIHIGRCTMLFGSWYYDNCEMS
jgi:hypothetical protein